MGVGIDLLDVDRFERALARRPGLRERLFDAEELAACNGTARPSRHLAARFCAKEATVKALGLRAVSLREIVVTGGIGNPPEIRLKGAAALSAGARANRISVSLTHERNIAAAVAVVGE